MPYAPRKPPLWSQPFLLCTPSKSKEKSFSVFIISMINSAFQDYCCLTCSFASTLPNTGDDTSIIMIMVNQ